MRSPLWFVVAGVIALASVVGPVLYMLPRLDTLDEGTIRVVVPGSGVLALDQPGPYTIFHERRSVIDGRAYASDSIAGLKVALVAEADGRPVALSEPRMSTRYEMGSREGHSLLAFDIARPGRYRLSASLPNGAAEPKLVLAVSQRLVGNVVGLVFTTLGVSFIGLGIAGLLVLVVVLRRAKAVAKPATGS